MAAIIFKLPSSFLLKRCFRTGKEVKKLHVTTAISKAKMPSDDNIPNKKLKTINEKESLQDGINDLSKFVFTRVLSDYGQRKTVCVEGKFSDREGKAILWLEKTHFSESTIKSLCSEKSRLKQEFINDIYGSYSCVVDSSLNEIKTSITYPATEQHINKFEQKPAYLIEETAEHYKNITLPHIEKEQFNIQWVYNVLNGEKEQDRVVFEDPDKVNGFLLLPDLKWNGKQTEDLYLLAIIHKHGIKSLRDLTAEHLPLLKNILEKGSA